MVVMKYMAVVQLYPYLRQMVDSPMISFVQRRRLMRFIEELEKEFSSWQKHIEVIKEKFCEKDADGKYVSSDSGEPKLKDGMGQESQMALMQMLDTDVELNCVMPQLPEAFFENISCGAYTTKIIEDYLLEES